MPVPTPPTVPDDRLTFPPFPTPPSGVALIPFSEYKEHGIKMYPTDGDPVERDGLGIPTVPLRVRHDTDVCKTETQRRFPVKTQVSKLPTLATVPGSRREWWDEWAENEDSRLSGPYNPHTASLDRLYEAAADFKRGRPWPKSNVGILSNWDQFRLFAGMLSNTPVWTRTDKQSPDESSSCSDDEEELEAEAEASQEPTTTTMQVDTQPQPQQRGFKRYRPRPPYALYGLEPVPVSSDAEVKVLFEQENSRREECMVEFLNDPEEQIKIFLSSYLRKQGLIWYDRNLVNFPRILEFFINFLLRNRVFPEAHIDRGLLRSLDIIKTAKKELILTSKLSKELPDKFSQAAIACWGRKADGFKPITVAESVDAPQTGDGDVGMKDPDSEQVQSGTNEEKSAVERFEEELEAADIQIIGVNDTSLMKEGETRQILDDNFNPASDVLPESMWGQSTWGDGPSNEATWGAWNATDANPEPTAWTVPNTDWSRPESHTLMTFLGPTALVNTHTTGIVEWSMRRIKSFAPPAPETLPKSPLSEEENPEAVDVELERRFTKMVLEPWIGWDREDVPHLAFPRILETSQGAVAGAVLADGRVERAAEPPVVGSGGSLKPHDPFQDDITVLVDPAVMPVLSVGLGLGATWVQIVHLQDLGEGGKKKKKKKNKAKSNPQRYWYIDELLMILPSYYT